MDIQTAENVHTKGREGGLRKTKRVNFKLDPRRIYVLDKVIVPALGRDRTYALTWLIDNYEALRRAESTVAAFREWEEARARLEAKLKEGEK